MTHHLVSKPYSRARTFILRMLARRIDPRLEPILNNDLEGSATLDGGSHLNAILSWSNMSVNPDCQCGHPYYDHVTWKEGTKYANNHSGCRIAKCGCKNYVSKYHYGPDDYCG